MLECALHLMASSKCIIANIFPVQQIYPTAKTHWQMCIKLLHLEGKYTPCLNFIGLLILHTLCLCIGTPTCIYLLPNLTPFQNMITKWGQIHLYRISAILGISNPFLVCVVLAYLCTLHICLCHEEIGS